MRVSASLALVLLCSRTATAAAQWIAVLPPTVEPEAPPEIRERFHDLVAQGFDDGGQPAVPNKDLLILLDRRPGLAACRDGPCVREISEALHVRRLVRPHVTVVGKTYDFKIDLLGGGSGRVLATSVGTCGICTLAEAEATLTAVATELAQNAPPFPPLRRVVKLKPAKEPAAPQPSGASVPASAADGKRAGFLSWSAHRYEWTAFGASFVGVAAAVAGVHFVLRHGDCVDPVPGETCLDHHNTGAVGAALVGASVVAFGGAAIATWLGMRSRKRVFVATSPGGGMAGAVFAY